MLKCVVFAAALGLLAAGSTHTATIYVPDDCPTIQKAINAAAGGDIIIVRPGTYYENIFFKGKAVTVRSEQGAAVTVINGKQSGSVVTFGSGEDERTLLDGFTITNGNGNHDIPLVAGGGILCCGSSPTITNNIISRNSAETGGGFWCRNSSPTIIHNTVTENHADFSGGGILLFQSSPVVMGNTISRNTTGGLGGGINCDYNSSPEIANCTITRNSAVRGGGIYITCHSHPTIQNNTISLNSSTWGGGIECDDQSSPFILSTILWKNSAPTGPDLFLTSGNPIVAYCNLKGGWPGGVCNIDADPLFVDPANGDFHLTWDSPCRNSGSPYHATPSNDFEGDPRITGGVVDMGADEYHHHLYHRGLVTPGFRLEIKVIGKPETSPVYLARGSGVQDPPQQTPYGNLYLQWPLLGISSLGAIPSSGVLVVSTTVPASWQSGDSYPFQTLIGPLGNPGSVLTNLMILDVE